VNLYLRLLRVLLGTLFIRRRPLLEPGCLRFRVWPTDCDINLHLNNGRYLAFMDLGRIHLIAQIGFLGKILRRQWVPVLTDAEIRFIRPLKPLQPFELVTRLLTWDENCFYIEQRFIAGGRLHAVGRVKGLFLSGRERVQSRTILEQLGLDLEPPADPESVRHRNKLAVK